MIRIALVDDDKSLIYLINKIIVDYIEKLTSSKKRLKYEKLLNNYDYIDATFEQYCIDTVILFEEMLKKIKYSS